MKRIEVKRIVEANIDDIKAMLGLGHWEIAVEYGKVKIQGSDRFNGRCLTDVVKYANKALITLVPKKLDDEGEVLDVLRHELVHCVVSSFDICMDEVAELVTKKEYKALLVLHYQVDEEVTKRICKILDSLKPFPAKRTCVFCGSKNSPDSVLIPIHMCCACMQGMIIKPKQ